MSAKHVLCSWLYLPLCLVTSVTFLTCWCWKLIFPKSHSPDVPLARLFGPCGLWRERLLNSVFISWINYLNPDNSWNHTLLEKSLPLLMNYPPSSLLSGLVLRLRSRQVIFLRWLKASWPLTMVAPGKAVPTVCYCCAPTFSPSPPSLSHRLFFHVRFRDRFRKWMKRCLQ